MSDRNILDDAIRELCVLTTRDEAGRHFTEWSEYYELLETLGLVEIDRPVHESGIPYDCEHWKIEITDDGQAIVDSRPDLHPAPKGWRAI